jgi:Tfp pilus assembly protein PilF
MNIPLIAKWGKIAPDTEPKLSEEERIANARMWFSAGNPYRARWELLKLLQQNPNNKTASEKLAQVENLIQRAHEKH